MNNANDSIKRHKFVLFLSSSSSSLLILKNDRLGQSVRREEEKRGSFAMLWDIVQLDKYVNQTLE